MPNNENNHNMYNFYIEKNNEGESMATSGIKLTPEEYDSLSTENAVQNLEMLILNDIDRKKKNASKAMEEGLGGGVYFSREDEDDDRFFEKSHFVKYIMRDGKHIKVWECGICGKEFGHQYTLMRHLPTHTDERKFQCNTCGKAFRQMSTLSQHRAIHSADRPYVCEVCRKTFNRVSTLISHRKTHTGDKPHRCHLCNKAFHQKGNLRNHIFTHTNERPYKCDVCNKGFNQMSNLMCHKIKAHQRTDKPTYSCQVCGKEFAKRMALRNHEQYQHGVTNTVFEDDDLLLPIPSTSSPKTSSASSLLAPALPELPSEATLPDLSAVSSQALETLPKPPSLVRRPFDAELRDYPEPPPAHQASNVSTSQPSNNGVLVEPIVTDAMKNAVKNGQTPFALLSPLNGIPVLVRVLSCGSKHMLVPATAVDLRKYGTITAPPKNATAPEDVNENNGNTVQIKIPVVATVVQQFSNGLLSVDVRSPGPAIKDDEEGDENVGENFFITKDNITYTDPYFPNMPQNYPYYEETLDHINYIDEFGNVITKQEFDARTEIYEENNGYRNDSIIFPLQDNNEMFQNHINNVPMNINVLNSENAMNQIINLNDLTMYNSLNEYNALNDLNALTGYNFNGLNDLDILNDQGQGDGLSSCN